MPKCPTCKLDPKQLAEVCTTLDLLKVVVTALANDPEFKEKGGIRIPADVVKDIKEKQLKFVLHAEHGEIICTAIDSAPTIHLPNNERVN